MLVNSGAMLVLYLMLAISLALVGKISSGNARIKTADGRPQCSAIGQAAVHRPPKTKREAIRAT